MLRQVLMIGAATGSFLLAVPKPTDFDTGEISLQAGSTRPTREDPEPDGEAARFEVESPGRREGGEAEPPHSERGRAGVSIRRIRVAAPAEMPGATEPDLDLDPLNPERVAVSATTGRFSGAGLVAYPAFFSADAGNRWERSAGEAPSHAADPGIEFDAAGHLFLSALDGSTGDGTPQGVIVARSDDFGRSYPLRSYALDSATRFAFPDGASRPACAPDESLLFDYPKLAADKSSTSAYRNSLYVIALALGFDRDGDGVCEGGSYVLVRSRDSGVTWEAAQALEGMKLHTSNLAVGSDGTLYLAQSVGGYGPTGIGSGILLRKSLDGGGSFQPPVTAHWAEGSPEPGATWTAADPAEPLRVYIAFEGRHRDGREATHIYLISSGDGGTTWSPPVRLDDSLPGGETDQLRPSIAVSDTGRVDAAWFDYRHSIPPKLESNRQGGDVYYAYSTDGGATWSRNLRLSRGTAPLIFAPGNDFLTLVSAGNRALAVFSQDTDGDDLYEAWLAEVTLH